MGLLGSLISLVSSTFTNQLSLGNFDWMMTTHSMMTLDMKFMKFLMFMKFIKYINKVAQ